MHDLAQRLQAKQDTVKLRREERISRKTSKRRDEMMIGGEICQAKGDARSAALSVPRMARSTRDVEFRVASSFVESSTKEVKVKVKASTETRTGRTRC